MRLPSIQILFVLGVAQGGAIRLLFFRFLNQPCWLRIAKWVKQTSCKIKLHIVCLTCELFSNLSTSASPAQYKLPYHHPAFSIISYLFIYTKRIPVLSYCYSQPYLYAHNIVLPILSCFHLVYSLKINLPGVHPKLLLFLCMLLSVYLDVSYKKMRRL